MSRARRSMHHSQQADHEMLTLQQQSGPSLAMLLGYVLRSVLPQQSSDLVSCPESVLIHQLSVWLSTNSVCHSIGKYNQEVLYYLSNWYDQVCKLLRVTSPDRMVSQ